MKFKAAQQPIRRDRYAVRAVRVYELVDQLMACLDDLSRQVNAMRQYISDKKPTLKCWNCGVEGHIRNNCKTPQSTKNKTHDKTEN
ncbi:hypothetical protein X975_13485, partial [Stegodyphus mimosarum]